MRKLLIVMQKSEVIYGVTL